ncbi:MAG TPA: hypothetical protein VD978_22670 [Azospirillum sp.]|nr:hypothetical protein [Azospirillum sp.]
MEDMNESHAVQPDAGAAVRSTRFFGADRDGGGETVLRGDAQGLDFGEGTFRGILTGALDRGYVFTRFDEPVASGTASGRPVFYLRHDVDISPPMAMRLGEIEHEHGVRANFFFQLNAETYSFFVTETFDIIRTLRGMGHCVGLHIDELLIGTDERAIEQTFDWVIDRIITVDRAVSFHRPSPEVLGRRYDRFMNAYDERIFDSASYLSDSRRSLCFHETLTAWLAEGRPRIQLLLHPEWWGEVDSLSHFWHVLSGRRTDQLRRYMVKNFPKVFADLLAGEDQRFRI